MAPDQIIIEPLAIMNSVGPDATTAALAAGVPLEKEANAEKPQEGVPGAFPETPAAVDPKDEETFRVDPLPAAGGAVNPVKLAPGEKIPEDLAAQSTTSEVKLDPESYEKSDTIPGAFSIPK